MLAKDLMRTEVITVRETEPIEEVIDMMMEKHIHGVPVIDAAGKLVGIVSQQDLFFGAMTRGESLRVRDIMTAPVVSASAETDVPDLCRMMDRLRIHRVPIVQNGKLCGIVSSLDVCGAVARKEPFD